MKSQIRPTTPTVLLQCGPHSSFVKLNLIDEHQLGVWPNPVNNL